MEPLTLATITSAVTVLATECLKGTASEAGKALWQQIRTLLGWQQDPQTDEIAIRVAHQLQSNSSLAQQLVKLLKENHAVGAASSLVNRIDAQGGKVVVAESINVSRDFQM